MKRLIYPTIIILAALSAANYKIFVFPNSFAPSGIDGICTMIQHIFGVNMGYLSLIVNIPLLVIGFFILKRDFIIKSTVYILAFSGASLLLAYLDIPSIAYFTESGTSTVLAPIAAGVIRGLLYAVTLKLGGSSGGVDIIAALIQKARPQYNLMTIILGLNISVALSSFFVYGLRIEPVICSIIYSFITSTVSKTVEASACEKVRFEIITAKAESLCKEISETLGESATVLDAQVAYSGKTEKLVICVTKKESAPKIKKMLCGFPEAVVFESSVLNQIRY